MSASIIIFYILAAVVLGGEILTVTSPKIFRAAIYLLFSLIGIAGLYFWLNYEFIAAVQVVVYVGGIVVLIIFSIFLTAGSGGDMRDPLKVRALFAGLATLTGYCLTYYVIQRTEFVAVTQPSIGYKCECHWIANAQHNRARLSSSVRSSEYASACCDDWMYSYCY